MDRVAVAFNDVQSRHDRGFDRGSIWDPQTNISANMSGGAPTAKYKADPSGGRLGRMDPDRSQPASARNCLLNTNTTRIPEFLCGGAPQGSSCFFFFTNPQTRRTELAGSWVRIFLVFHSTLFFPYLYDEYQMTSPTSFVASFFVMELS